MQPSQRAMSTRRFSYDGTAITFKRQQTAYDRIVSAPAQACMDIVSRHEGKYQGCLKPNWRGGYVAQTADRKEPEILFRWLVSPERARIRIYVVRSLLHHIENEIDAEIRQLQFGPILSDKGKGKGKAKKGKKIGAPVDPHAFKQEPAMVKDHLGNLTFARYPLNISIRELTAEQVPQMGSPAAKQSDSVVQNMEVDKAGQAPKRYANANETEQQAKRRSPTPARGGSDLAEGGAPYPPPPAHQQHSGCVRDPWAAAASSTARSSSSFGRHLVGVWIGGVWNGRSPESEKYFSEAEICRKIPEIPQKERFLPNN